MKNKINMPGFSADVSNWNMATAFDAKKPRFNREESKIFPAMKILNYSCSSNGRNCPITCLILSGGDVLCYCDCSNPEYRAFGSYTSSYK